MSVGAVGRGFVHSQQVSDTNTELRQLLVCNWCMMRLMQVANELLAFEILATLTAAPTDDSVEIAVNFLKECGAFLEDVARGLVHRWGARTLNAHHMSAWVASL